MIISFVSQYKHSLILASLHNVRKTTVHPVLASAEDTQFNTLGAEDTNTTPGLECFDAVDRKRKKIKTIPFTPPL